MNIVLKIEFGMKSMFLKICVIIIIDYSVSQPLNLGY